MSEKILLSLIYFSILIWLGWKGYRATTKGSDYMIAGRAMNPFVMGMSYGATSISTAGIIGYGGAAGHFGLSLMWGTVLYVGIGVFVAMVFFGPRTRRLGLALNAQTFPELLGRRCQSDFVQGFAGSVIFLFIPIYAAAVLIGIARLLQVSLDIPYEVGLIAMTAIVATYVTVGGLKAVMYTDAFQGSVMLCVMAILMVFVYLKLGGIVAANEALAGMAHLIPENLRQQGLVGWTDEPDFKSPLDLTIYTTLVYGVGVGVLAQPQLIVRYMTVSDDRNLNRAVLFAGIFVPVVFSSAFVTGALSNVLFFREFGEISMNMAEGNADKIIPTFIGRLMPDWFGALFLIGMFSAAMSTLSSQYHVGGTSLGYDVYEAVQQRKRDDRARFSQLGVLMMIFATLVWAWLLPGSIIARAAAFFFGLCSATFLPVFVLGLYWKGLTRIGAVVAMVGGFVASMLWLTFVHLAESSALGVSQLITGKPSIVADATPMSWTWLLQYLDPNLVALPVGFVLAVVVSLATSKMDERHLKVCWANF